MSLSQRQSRRHARCAHSARARRNRRAVLAERQTAGQIGINSRTQPTQPQNNYYVELDLSSVCQANNGIVQSPHRDAENARDKRRRRAEILTQRRQAGLQTENSRDNRRRRAHILAQRRQAGQIPSNIRRQQTRARQQTNGRASVIIADRHAATSNRSRTQITSSEQIDLHNNSENDSETDIVVQHFNRMRNRPSRRPIQNDLTTDERDINNSDDERLGVQNFSSPNNVQYPLEPYQLRYSFLLNENNYVCPYCSSVLRKEEKNRYNCCNKER